MYTMKSVKDKGLTSIISNLDNNEMEFVLRQDECGVFTYVSSNVTEVLGYMEDELLHKNYQQFVHPEDEFHINRIPYNDLNGIHTLTYRFLHKCGEYVSLNATVIIVKNPTTHLPMEIVSMNRLMKKPIEAEGYLLETEKLSVVGQLAAGVAQEIRNPLTALKGFLQLLKASPKQPQGYLEIMEDEIERIDAISRELLILSKPYENEYKKCSIYQIAQSTLTLLEVEATKNRTEIELKTNDVNAFIMCDEYKIKQVMINLLKNAIEAMEYPGVITISIIRHFTDVQISIKDEGIGINKRFISRLGEPFFTTKETGNGLGLMICYKIIRDHQGLIEFDSKEGEGTTVTFRLPIKP